jgi:sporulation integral membrane protein YtvI
MLDYTKKLLITLAILIGIVLAGLFIYYALPHFLPFFLAFLIALLLEPLNRRLTAWLKVKRYVAANLTYFLFLGLLGFLNYIVIAKITRELFDLVRTIQQDIPQISNWFLYLYKQTQDFISLLPPEQILQINNAYENFVNQFANINLISVVGSFTYSIGTAIPNFFFSSLLFLISLYLINLNLPSIQERFYSYFKPESHEKLGKVLGDLKAATVGFIHAQIILSSITYLITLTGLLVLDVSYASVIALAIVVVDILPVVGTGSVIVPWALFSFLSKNTYLAVGLLILFILITVIRRIIEPKVLGHRIGLGTLSTLISLWVGFKVLGVIGVLVGPLLLILGKALIKAEVIRSKISI